MAHIHSVFDSSEHFVIDPVSREITNSLAKKIVVMQNDHNSERFTFEVPNIDGHDMTACDRIEIHYINIDATDKSLKSASVYEVEDIRVSPGDNRKSVFSWLLSRQCTKYAGTLSFLIRFACTTGGVEEYAWHTAIFQSITIGNGLNNGTEELIEPFVDVIAQWKADLFGVGDTDEQRLLIVSAEQQAAIAAKGAAVLDSIPDEYEALSAMVDQNHRNKAGAIVPHAEGESIVVKDASDCYLQGLKLFGRSTQNGTPTPDAPVDIVSVGESVVSVHGKNLLNLPQTISKDRAIYNYDLFTGTAGSSQPIPAEFIDKLPILKAGVDYYFSYNIPEDVEGKKILIQVVLDGGETSINKLVAEQPGVVRVEEDTMITLRANSSDVYTIQDIQLEIGTEKTDYEPYTKQEITIPHTLPGIPVSGGGNYTDADGQQWICDEVDLKRGVYVQRVELKTFVLSKSPYEFAPLGYRYQHYAGNDFTPGNICLCKTLPYNDKVGTDNETTDGVRINKEAGYIIAQYTDTSGTVETIDLDILYILATPIETPLSDAEINAFKALHSNKPHTTILNDSGAHMSVEYVADTKTYIDNKIAEMMKGLME